jgi:hypothetical protein
MEKCLVFWSVDVLVKTVVASTVGLMVVAKGDWSVEHLAVSMDT